MRLSVYGKNSARRMIPRPYLYPVYGLLVGIFVAVIYLAVVVVPSQSVHNRNIVLYCVRANVATALDHVSLPKECKG